jgi:hypothetical protein
MRLERNLSSFLLAMVGTRIKEIVEELFTVIRNRSTEEEMVFVCPVPGCADETGNRSVNLKTGRTNCWRCNKGGDFAKWLHFLGYAVEEGETPSKALDQMDLQPWAPQAKQSVIVRDIPLPLGFHRCADYPRSVYTQLIGEMAVRKHLQLEDFIAVGVGFTLDDPKWEPYAIFPVFDYGRTVYWQGRTYDDVPGESTKRFPNRTEAPYGAKYWVYGIDELRESKTPVVLVVESILNVLSLRRYMREKGCSGVTPVCVFKHYLSTPQARKIFDLPFVKEVCLLYDHDATLSAWQRSPRVSDRGLVTVAQMPPGFGGAKNDPNDDPAAAWKVFKARVRADRLNSTLALGFDKPSAIKPIRTSVLESPLDRLQTILGSDLHDSRDQKTVRRPRSLTTG